jgi:YD repeat-containing protein
MSCFVASACRVVVTTYERRSKCSVQSDANGHVTEGYYNKQGYVNAVTYPGYSGGAPSYNNSSGRWTGISGADSIQATSYDPIGDVLTKIDGRGVTTSYSYSDPESNLSGVTYASSNPSVPALPQVSLNYDSFGRPYSINNGVTQIQYAYDDDDSPTNEVTNFLVPGFSKTISYTYNPDGSKASTVTPSGYFTYSYDAAQRPSSITNPFDETTNWGYLNNSWLNQQISANGASASYSYNALGELTQMANSADLRRYNKLHL